MPRTTLLKRVEDLEIWTTVSETAEHFGVKARNGRLRVFDTRTLRSLGQVSGGVGPTHVVAEPEGCFYTLAKAEALVAEKIRHARSLRAH